jgi:hypothetical protein
VRKQGQRGSIQLTGEVGTQDFVEVDRLFTKDINVHQIAIKRLSGLLTKNATLYPGRRSVIESKLNLLMQCLNQRRDSLD